MSNFLFAALPLICMAVVFVAGQRLGWEQRGELENSKRLAERDREKAEVELRVKRLKERFQNVE